MRSQYFLDADPRQGQKPQYTEIPKISFLLGFCNFILENQKSSNKIKTGGKKQKWPRATTDPLTTSFWLRWWGTISEEVSIGLVALVGDDIGRRLDKPQGQPRLVVEHWTRIPETGVQIPW